jgi:two-component system nitrate/nitrite response regulator NarL
MSRVLIVDDHRLFADALHPILRAGGLDVVGIASSVAEAWELARSEAPDVVLLDLCLPGGDSVQLGKNILDVVPGVRIFVLTGMNDGPMLRGALAAGFHGYLTKDMRADQVIASVMSGADGQVVLSRSLAFAANGSVSAEQRAAESRAAALTPREKEVLSLLVEGADTTTIASTLYLSPKTIRTHVQRVLAKLGVHSRVEAVSFAVRYGVGNGRRPAASVMNTGA